MHYFHSQDLWKDAPLTRFEALKIMTTKVDKADGTGNFTHIEAIREFSKWFVALAARFPKKKAVFSAS